jgi:hypothetical protein
MSPEDSALMPSNDDDAAAAADPANASDPTLRRRMFLRKMTADAILAGGRLAGSARIIQRSATAAGETLLRELEAGQVASKGPPTTSGRPILPEPGGTTRRSDAPSSPQPFHGGESQAPSFPALTPAQEALLASAVPAALATIQLGSAPQLTASPFHWDGRVFRISALDWTARTQNIQIDPRVSLLIADPTGDLSLSVTGSAAIVAGPSARDETLPILRKEAVNESEVSAQWTALNANGDRVVIVVVPERMLWKFDDPAWRSVGSSDAARS